MVKIVEIRVANAVTRSGLPDIDYALNPYIGCLHGCRYCYAPSYVMDTEVSRRWGSLVKVKKNIADVLEKEVKSIAKNGGVVGIGTVTDPYQPIEARYELTRRCIDILCRNGVRVSIQTKSILILRDLNIIEMYKDRIDVGITLTSLDPRFAAQYEPLASSPKERVFALEKLSEIGVETWIFLGPIIPGENDDVDMIKQIIEIASATNSRLYIDKLRVKPHLTRVPELKDIVLRVKNYRWKPLFEALEAICRSMNVRCIFGLGDVERRRTLYSYVR